MKRYLLLWLMFLGLYGARGQQGALDPSFSGDGLATLHYFSEANANDEEIDHILPQPDGKYIAFIGGGNQLLARYNADGTLDQSFGSSGYAPIHSLVVYSAALQPDGKIVLGGYWYNENAEQWQAAVSRYNSNGTPDTDFGSGGVVFIDFAPYGQGGYTIYATALAIQSDGKIIAVGTGYYSDGTLGHYAWLAARLINTGALDASFGTGGIKSVELGGYIDVSAVALQSDKIVLGGRSQDPVYYWQNFTLVRLLNDGTNDGTLDASFGTGGLVTTSFGGDAFLESLAVQPDGKIVAAGTVYLDDGSGNTTGDLALARYLNDGTNDGTLDASFGTGGLVTTNLGQEEAISAMALGPGSIVVAGIKSGDDGTGSWYSDLLLARYLNDGTADGTLDASFNPGGTPAGTLVSDLPGDDYVFSLAVLSGGSIVVAGGVYNSTVQNADYLLARYTNTGALDNTFNPTGTPAGLLTAYYTIGTESDITALAVQPDGKVVVAGTGSMYDPGSGNYFQVMAVARFNPDGTRDGSFGTNGVAYADFIQNTYDLYQIVTSVALAPGGKIVVGGYTDYYDPGSDRSYQDFTLARFTSAGVLDADFGGGDGMVTNDWNPNDWLRALTVQSDGKIVAVGQSFDEYVSYETLNFFVARYKADGTLDETFDTDGLVSTDFFGYEDFAVDVAIQSDGKIVVAGGVENYDETSGYFYNFGLARYTSTGVLDSRFGTGGKAIASNFAATGGGFLALQSDGKILVGGMYENQETNYNDLVVVRFTSRGTLDGTFGTNGMATTSLGISTYDIYPGPIALQSDGKILQTARYEIYDPGSDQWSYYLALARYTSAGVPDNTFDTDGKVAHPIDNNQYYYYFLSDIAWDNGRLYTAGVVWPNTGNEPGYLEAYIAGEAVQPLPVVTIEDAEVTEGGTASVTVRVNTTNHPDLTLSYATQDGSATSKGKVPDYKAARSSLTILNGSDVGTISIITYNDADAVSEDFTVNLSAKGRAADLVTLGDNQATVTILAETAPPVTNALTTPELPEGRLAVKAFPNPTSSYFTVQLHSGNSAPVVLKVTDLLGRLVETKAGVAANSTLQLGSNYRPGVYYVHLQQGSEKQTLKLVKGTQ